MDVSKETDIDRTEKRKGNPATKPLLHDNEGKTIRIVGIGRDITENKLSEKQVMLANERMRYLLSATSAVIYTTGTKDDYEATFVSENITQMTGYKPVEMDKPDFWISHIHPDDRQRILAKASKMSDKEFRSYEYRFLHKSGRYIWIQDEARIIRNEAGEPLELVGSWKDITERKQAENTLRESELRFRELFEHISSGVAVYEAADNGKDFIIRNFNKSAEKIDNIRREEIIGKSVLDVFPAIKDFGLFDIFQRVWQTGRPEHHPASLYKGKRIVGWRKNYVYKLPSGNIVAVYDDVTSQKTAEEALRKSEQEKELILSSVAEVITYQDKEHRIVWGSKAAGDLTGFTADEMVGRYCYEVWHHTDKPCQDCLVQKAIQTGLPQESEMLGPIGNKIWLVRGYPVLDKNGSVMGVVKTALDITERRQAEESLRQSQQMLQLVLDTIPVSVFWKDRNLVYLGCNRMQALKAGLNSPEQIVGKNDFELCWAKNAESYRCDDQDVIQTGKSKLNYEEPEIISSGEEIWVRTSKVPLQDTNNNVIGVLGTYEDVTERKQIEKQLLEYQKKLKSLASRVFLTAENERRRLAIGIHDQLGQQLAIIKLKLQSLVQTVEKTAMFEPLSQICSEVDHTIEDAHSLTFELSNPVLYEIGLEAAVEQWLTEQIEEKYGIKCRFSADAGSIQLDSERRTILFQAFRELLVNVVKHAGAGVVEVDIRKKGEKICISVRDNGVGFVPFEKGMHPSTSKKGGFGLFGIREQIEYYDGTIKIESVPKQGTCITICMPLSTNTTVLDKWGIAL
jgi:PAS domain S-box-containing protein